MNLGPKGTALIQSYEKCVLTAYQDPKGVWTIGWGHTGPEVVEGLVWTQDEADRAFVNDSRAATLGVLRSLDIALPQDSFDALVAFTFNVGVTAEGQSTLHTLVNARDWDGAEAEWPKWNHTGGKVSAGLNARRAAELELFKSGLAQLS